MSHSARLEPLTARRPRATRASVRSPPSETRQPGRDRARDDGPPVTAASLAPSGEQHRLQRVDERRADSGTTSAAAAQPAARAIALRRSAHATFSVNGAVSTCPSTWVWRNSRQVPATGTSTPTVSLPGVVELPVTFAAAEQGSCSRWRRALQTCVWK